MNNDEKIEQLEKLKAEYEQLIPFIKDLNKASTKKAIVPIQDNLAYFIGDIRKTNECKIYLGEDYLVETTNHIAIKIVEDRLRRLNLMILQNNEKNNIPLKLNEISTNIEEENNTIEIKEEISDQDYSRLKTNLKSDQSEVDNTLQEKLKVIKARREQSDNNDDGSLLIRKIRKVKNEVS
jgi:prefoldin subunit 5